MLCGYVHGEVEVRSFFHEENVVSNPIFFLSKKITGYHHVELFM